MDWQTILEFGFIILFITIVSLSVKWLSKETDSSENKKSGIDPDKVFIQFDPELKIEKGVPAGMYPWKNPWDGLLFFCKEIIGENFFDEDIIKQINDLVETAKKERRVFPGRDLIPPSYAIVFNTVACDLMTHKYNISSTELDGEGRKYLHNLRVLGNEIVSKGIITSDRLNELMRNISDVIFFRKERAEIKQKLNKQYTEIIEKYYKVFYETLSEYCSKEVDLRFEIIPFMYIIGIVAVKAEYQIQNDQNSIDNLILSLSEKLDEFTSSADSSIGAKLVDENEKELFEERLDLYTDITNGGEYRGDWCLAGIPDVIGKDIFMRCMIVLGDLLTNPDCGKDYYAAPVCINGIFEMEAFQNMLIGKFSHILRAFSMEFTGGVSIGVTVPD